MSATPRRKKMIFTYFLAPRSEVVKIKKVRFSADNSLNLVLPEDKQIIEHAL
jgi:hypothetical protein